MRHFIVGLSVVGVLTGCVSQPLPKNPPLIPYTKKDWVAVNAYDFVPPKAKTYIKVQEIELDTVPTEQPEQE